MTPSARAEKLSAMRWRRTGRASAITSSTDGASRPSMQGAGAAGQHQRLAGARAGSPGDVLAHDVEVAAFRPAGAHQPQDRLDHALADRQAADQAPAPPSGRPASAPAAALARRRRWCAISIRRSAASVGIADIDLHQEAVELRFGQRIGAFLLQRVLGRQHVERRGQVVALGRRP